MISEQKIATVQATGIGGLCVNMKPQLTKLGVGKGEKVYVCCEEIDGKIKIIIERVK